MTSESLLEIMLIAASIGLAGYCAMLGKRLRKLNDLESGLGGAIAVMVAEVDRLERAIRGARDEATSASQTLAEEITTARKERELWELRQKIGAVAFQTPKNVNQPVRRRRKRVEANDA